MMIRTTTCVSVNCTYTYLPTYLLATRVWMDARIACVNPAMGAFLNNTSNKHQNTKRVSVCATSIVVVVVVVVFSLIFCGKDV